MITWSKRLSTSVLLDGQKFSSMAQTYAYSPACVNAGAVCSTTNEDGDSGSKFY